MKLPIEGLVLGVAFTLAACGGGTSGGTGSSSSSSSSSSAGSSAGSESSSSGSSGAGVSSSAGSGFTGSRGTTGTTGDGTGTTSASSSGSTSAGSGGGSSTIASSGGSTGAIASGTTGTTGGTGTSGGSSSAGAACPAGSTKCVPANPCDLGCSAGSGCVDQNTANAAQTGVTCDAGAVCEGQLCLSGSGPQLPYQDGGFLVTPNIVMMTYAVDPNQAALEGWTRWFAGDGYLPQTVGQYGVGNATVQLVSLPDALGSLPSQYAIQQYLATEMATNPAVPAFSPNNIYLLMLPYAWSDTSNFCQTQGGYHSVFQDAVGDDVVYGVVADCGQGGAGDLLFDEVALSHEIAEASTDPWISGWTFLSTANAWSYIGGEVGDMCESNSGFYENDAGYAAQLLWSNAAAAAGQPPCQPWPANQVYVTVLGDSTLVPTAPGTSVQVPVTGWASGPTADWTLAIADSFYGVGFSTSPTLSSSTIGPGGQVTAQLSVPAAATGQPAVGGQVGAAYVTTQLGANYDGWLLVGVVATCQATGDCADETTVCALNDAGVGECVSNPCAPDAGQFSSCPVLGASDGVCVPADFGSGPVELCNQAGSIPVGDGGCQPSRLVGGGASEYCVPGASCATGQTTSVCATLCTGAADGGAQGGCATGEDCVSLLSPYYGVCLQDCTAPGSSCPSNQTCYSMGSFSICYPN